MDKTLNIIWDEVIKRTKELSKNNSDIIMYYDSYDVFKSNFYYYDNLIRRNFMYDVNSNLDRHKVASIIICAILNNDILGIKADSRKKYENDVFLANEKIALNIALSYMYDELKIAVQKNELPYKKVFEKYAFPNPYTCERKYDMVLCRDLYYAKKYFTLNPLTIANYLFMLEDYSFKVHGIECSED